MVKVLPGAQKLRGGYYTPAPIARFLAEWAIRSPDATVLEPSCGDGALLASAAQRLLSLGASSVAVSHHLHATELDTEEAHIASKRLADIGIHTSDQFLHVADFFAYCRAHYLEDRFLDTVLSPGQRFDAILGNPPFIRYQHFPPNHQALAFEMMRRLGFHPNRLTNAWVPFLLICAHLLADDGRLAFVIPAELFQVSYAAEVRQFLSDYFQSLTLVTFRNLVFPEIQQEIILLLAEKRSAVRGIHVVEIDNLDELASLQSHRTLGGTPKPLNHSTEKWTQYYLSAKEIELLRSLKSHPHMQTVSEKMEVDVGIVTGQNDVFLLTDQQVAQHHIPLHYLTRIVSRSGHLEGITFRDADWEANAAKHVPAYLLTLPKAERQALPLAIQVYLDHAEAAQLHTGYKCRMRSPWFAVPSLWVPDAFLLRQVHGYTKVIANNAQAMCTDTIHRVRLKPGITAELASVALLNSMSFAFAEVTGRSYGGGVLTFEPSEAEQLPIVLQQAERLDTEELDGMLRQHGIEAVLERTDTILLGKGLGLGKRDIATLHGIWIKLRDRRIHRK
jgi:adenine-specific DNA-methyltransferase